MKKLGPMKTTNLKSCYWQHALTIASAPRIHFTATPVAGCDDTVAVDHDSRVLVAKGSVVKIPQHTAETPTSKTPGKRHQIVGLMMKVALVVILLCCLSRVLAQEIAVPVDVQATLLLKTLTFDRNLKARVGQELVIGVLYQRMFKTSNNIKDDWLRAISEAKVPTMIGLPYRSVAIDAHNDDQLLAELVAQGVDVLYLTPLRAVDLKGITGICRDRQILTLTGVPEYVDSGIAVGIGIKGERPQIIINLNAARTAGADFSSQLLKLAKVLN